MFPSTAICWIVSSRTNIPLVFKYVVSLPLVAAVISTHVKNSTNHYDETVTSLSVLTEHMQQQHRKGTANPKLNCTNFNANPTNYRFEIWLKLSSAQEPVVGMTKPYVALCGCQSSRLCWDDSSHFAFSTKSALESQQLVCPFSNWYRCTFPQTYAIGCFDCTPPLPCSV